MNSNNKIALIYFYLISVVSIGLLIAGTFYLGNLIINLTQYDKYPLRYGVENCEYPYLYPKGPYPADLQESTPSPQERVKQEEICHKQNELERKQHKLEDIKNAAIFTLIGAVLFFIHYPKARKHTN